MYDSYEWGQSRRKEERLRIVDYRNAKYQGTTAGARMVRSGVGMALDHNYLLALAAWRAGRVEGEALVVYPDNSLFAGRVQKALPAGLCTYQVSKKCKIYGSLGTGEEDLFVFEDSKARSLVFLGVGREVMRRMSEDPLANEYILLEEAKQNAKAVRMQQQDNYSEDEKWDAIEKFLKTIVKTEHKDYREFVKYYFGKRADAELAVEIGQAKEEFQFNFKNSSIICRLIASKTNEAEFRVKLMGYYDHLEQKMEIAKKGVSGTGSVEESVKGEGIVYSETPMQRPADCVRRLHRYYRESLNFHNDYLEIDYLYRIKFIFHSIEEYIVHTSTNKYAQQLLENVPSPDRKRPSLADRQEKELRHIPISQEEYLNRDHLSKVREEIYKAVQKKSLSKSHSTAQHKASGQSFHEESRYGQIYPRSPSRHEESLYDKAAHSPKRREKKYLEEDHSLSRVSTNQGQGRKSYVYLDESAAERQEKSKPKERATPGKYDYSKGLGEKKEPASQLSKFAYLEKTEAKRTQKKL